MGLISGSGRSVEGNGNPLQYSWLENPRDREEPCGLQSMELQRFAIKVLEMDGEAGCTTM